MPSGIDGIEVVDDPYAAVEGAEVLAVPTEWDEFRWLDLDKVAAAMAALNVLDARNLLDRAVLLPRGFAYSGFGRSSLHVSRSPEGPAPSARLSSRPLRSRLPERLSITTPPRCWQPT